jgi:Lamin Tail Domain
VSIARPSPALRRPLAAALAVATIVAAMAPMVPGALSPGRAATAPDHLVISELVTGGASASDEFIELHNPTDTALPLEGLEVVYATASGATVTRRAAWALGAPSVPPRGHVLVANEAGFYAGIANALYVSGMAATGGSVAVRIQGAATVIDAIGWGTATGTWLEGTPAPAPAAGSSLERLPGGLAGSGTDTGDNAADTIVRLSPEPQNLGSPPTPDPAATPTPTPADTTEPTAEPTFVATPEPTVTPQPTAEPTTTPVPPSIASVAEARLLPDGTRVTVEATAIASSNFHDGGGFVADVSGGVAVIVDGGAFSRGERLRISGEIDDRFSQRTLRAAGSDVVPLGPGTEPPAAPTTTGALREALEGTLVRVAGTIAGSATVLTSGLAYDVDDGSGVARVVVGTAAGIGTDAWVTGARVDLIGVAGQRDSTGSGTDGYRVLPRDSSDVISVSGPSPSPSATAEPAGSGSASPSPSPSPGGVVPISDARTADAGTRLRVRGVVTLPSNLVDDGTAVIQDGSGAILLRVGDEAEGFRLGADVDVTGTRSTLSGMASIRVAESVVLGSRPEPAPATLRTGDAADGMEARLVLSRGAVVASARRSASGSVSFEIDDGSGAVRVSVAGSLRLDRRPLVAGTWVEVRGVLGQQTSRSKPDEGYRIWPRRASEVRVVAASVDRTPAGPGASAPTGGASEAGLTSLDGIDTAGPNLARLRVGATLVDGRWSELDLAGLLWDGERLVAIHDASSSLVETFARRHGLPAAVDLGGLTRAGTDPATGAARVRLGAGDGALVAGGTVAAPRATLAGPMPAWVSLVGTVARDGDALALDVGDATARVELRCAEDGESSASPRGTVTVTGVATGDPARILVACDGIRAAPIVAAERAPVAATHEPSAGPDSALAAATASDRRRGIASALFAAAAAVVVVTALLRRRLAGDDPDPAVDGAATTDTPEQPDASTPPRLTLVPISREHGS